MSKLGVCLVFAAVIAVSGAASAQGVSLPFDDSVCMSPLDVTGSLHDPNGFYASAPKCEKLCSKALKDCKQYVKDAASCEKAEIDDDASYEKTECEVEFEHGQETKTCKTEVEDSHGSDHATSNSNRSAALAACESWANTCKSTCGAAATGADDHGTR